jgi:hypothetical protein
VNPYASFFWPWCSELRWPPAQTGSLANLEEKNNMNKTKAIFASLALVAVAMAPLALAHNNSTSHPLINTSDGASNRVSGVYYKDVSALVGFAGPSVPLPPGVPAEVTDVTGNPVGTSFTLGIANALCDMEVLSPGDGTADALDEPQIDAVANTASALGLTLFNDGGVGAVCHTHTNYYANSAWNTAGCTYDPATGTDLVSARVWLTTVCDYGHGTGGVSLVSYVQSCANNLLTNDVAGLVTCATALAACVATAVQGLGSCPLTTGFACGDDGSGSGGVQTPGNSGWSNVGVAFESVPAPCADSDGAASVFVWTAVFVDASNPAGAAVSVPTVGEIQ